MKYEKCPRCSSYKITKITKLKGFFFSIALFSCSIWLLIIPPIGIFCMLLGLIIMPISLVYYPKNNCRNCRYTWKPGEK